MPYRYQQPGNWKTTRRRILARDGHTCVCGAPATQVDAIVPESQGGTHDDDDNLRSLCEPCHAAKSASERRAGMARHSRRRPTEQHPGAT